MGLGPRLSAVRGAVAAAALIGGVAAFRLGYRGRSACIGRFGNGNLDVYAAVRSD
jgi:hypothetical protein